jgi:hypothetical protein
MYVLYTIRFNTTLGLPRLRLVHFTPKLSVSLQLADKSILLIAIQYYCKLGQSQNTNRVLLVLIFKLKRGRGPALELGLKC